jgi:hypothetical protein
VDANGAALLPTARSSTPPAVASRLR